MDVAAIIVVRAGAAWAHGYTTHVLCMDSKAAVSSVANVRLVNSIMLSQMDGDLIQWTKWFVLEGTLEMIIKGDAMQGNPVDPGVPQGSPV
jgi:hypothetical protein